MSASLFSLVFVLLLITPAILGTMHPLSRKQRIPARVPLPRRNADRHRS